MKWNLDFGVGRIILESYDIKSDLTHSVTVNVINSAESGKMGPHIRLSICDPYT